MESHMTDDDYPERKTVLVVDDEESSARLHADILGDDYDVRLAYSGTEALEQIDNDVDVLLLDRMMDDLSGDEVLQRLKRRNLEIRVALVTAIDPDYDILELGFDDYLVKPIDREALRETVRQLVLLDEYIDKQADLGSLRVQRNILQMEKTDAELEDNDEYQKLQSAIDGLESELEELKESIPEEYVTHTD